MSFREPTGLEIAVTALACRFPGAGDAETFWAQLADGVESVTWFSEDELRAAGVSEERLADPNYVRASAIVDGVELFDAAFFGLNPREAELLDPQHRIFLETAWEALESAGHDPQRYGGRGGVFAGCGFNSYLLQILSNPAAKARVDGYQLSIAADKDHLATQVAYKLNLRGPGVGVQTACSTSLVAIHLACQSLLNGECDLALAGGVSLNVPQHRGHLHQPGSILSPDGRCRPFDAEARGIVVGGGSGVVVLKRLEDAVAEGDPIRAVVLGSAINNDGAAKVGYTAPSAVGQAAVLAAAHLMAEVEPSSVGYVEAHGTGTELGDAIELEGLRQVFEAGGGERPPCALGSVKSNFGHLDAAAGVAGFIKTVLALERGVIPPTLHFEKPNPKLEGSPFEVNTELCSWPSVDGPRRAGVSSFGIGGTNAHVVLEEAPERPAPTETAVPDARLLVLSARTSTALEAMGERLAEHVAAHPELSLSDLTHTLQIGRRELEYRRHLVFRDREELLAGLAAPDPRRDRRVAGASRSLAFLFPGQGSQYPGMGRGLYAAREVYRETLDRCLELLEPHLETDLGPLLLAAEVDGAAERLERTELAQPALFSVEYALAQLWMSWGMRPEVLLGHSLGEWVAACLAGVFRLEDALRLVARRGRLMQRLPPGSMLAVSAPADEVEGLLGEELSLAAVNAPRLSVVSGPTPSIENIARELAARDVETRALHTSHAFHSRAVEPVAEVFRRDVAGVALGPPEIPFVSNVTGTWITPEEATDPGYWAKQLSSPVLFSVGAAELLSEPGRLLLEVGPGRTLGALLRQQPGAGRRTFSSLRHPRDEISDPRTMAETLGGLWTAGAKVDWELVRGAEPRRRVALPTYPFERQRYWIEGGRGTAALTAGTPVGDLPLEDPPPEDLRRLAARIDPAERPEILGAFTEAMAALGKLAAALGGEKTPRVDLYLAEPESPGRLRLLLAEDETAQGGETTTTAPAAEPGWELYERPDVPTPYEAPSSAVEHRLVEIWQDLLAIEPVGIGDHFFDLGGHSLLATRAISQIREEFEVEVELRAFLEHSTIAALAETIEAQRSTGLSAPAITPHSPGDRAPDGRFPLSFAQERLWFLAQLEEGSAAYNLPNVLRLRGHLEKTALHRALGEIVRRHQVLRGVFREVDEEPFLEVLETVELDLPEIDLSRLPESERADANREAVIAASRQPLELGRAPLLRPVLLRLGPEEHVFVVIFHHIASDGWSIGVFYDELAQLYNAELADEPSPLAPLAIQYPDFARWQRQYLEGSVLERLERYWSSALTPLPTLELPTDRPRPAVFSYRGAGVERSFDGELSRRLRRLAQREEATLFMVLLSVFTVLLHQRSGEREIVVGTDIANRNRREIEGLIGFFVNQLVLRTRLVAEPSAGLSFRQLLAGVKETTLDAYEHQDLPFERVVELLNPPRDRARSPLFQVKLTLQNGRRSRSRFRGLELQPLEIHHRTAKLDLLFDFTDLERGLLLICEYSTDLFDAGTVERLIDDFEGLAAAAAADPDRPVHELVATLNDTEQKLQKAAAEKAEAARWSRFAHLAPRSGAPAALGDHDDE